MTELVGKAKDLLEKSEGVVCVVVDSTKDAHFATHRGVKPLVDWLRNTPKVLKGGFVADKVIGKAAAMLMVYGGVKEVYGGIISESAAQFLQDSGVPFTAGKKVPFIVNRDNTGMCPMESRAQSLKTPQEAFQVFDEIVE